MPLVLPSVAMISNCAWVRPLWRTASPETRSKPCMHSASSRTLFRYRSPMGRDYSRPPRLTLPATQYSPSRMEGAETGAIVLRYDRRPCRPTTPAASPMPPDLSLLAQERPLRVLLVNAG